MRPLSLAGYLLLASSLLSFTSAGLPGGVGHAAGLSRRDAPTEAAILLTMRTFRHAVAVGDSAAAVALFTRAAWLLDQTEPLPKHRFVHLAGCRGWCRPASPLRQYRVSLLPGPDTAVVVETYYRDTPVSTRRRRVPGQGYTAISVVVRQHDQWLISSHTLCRAPAE